MRAAMLTLAVLFAGCRCRGDRVTADDSKKAPDSEAVKVCLEGVRGLSNYSDRCEQSHLWWGSIDRAVEQLRPACERLVVAPGARFVRAEVEKCNAALEKAPCFQPLPPECQIPGTLKAGEACAFGVQCGPGLTCGLGHDAACGKCMVTSRNAGDSCDGEGEDAPVCGEGLVCLRQTHKCTAPLGPGATCSDMTDCQRPLICEFKDGPEGVCIAPRKAGEPCTAMDCEITLQCEGGTCKPRALPKNPGASCSDSLDCLDYACVHGVCRAPLQVGKKCGEETAPCAPSLMCIKGKCVLPDARDCH